MSELASRLLENLYYVVAIVGGTASGVIYLWRGYRRRSKRLDEEFSRNWTNEGDPTSDYSHYVDLELDVEDGKVSGVIHSRSLESECLMPNTSLVGKRRGKKVIAELVDLVHGRRVNYGEVEIRLKDDRIHWTLKTVEHDGFPEYTVMWPDPRHT